jgi:lipoprotein-releasing system ATP-binding protein
MSELSSLTSPVMNSQTAPVVQLIGVHKSFNVGEPTEVEVLHGIDLVLCSGEFVAVMGPSGSGKSTLLNIVGLLDRPTQGQLQITGLETTTLDDQALTQLRGRSIGFVFQYHHLIGAFSALENVMLPMVGLQSYPTAAIEQRAQSLLKSVGLLQWQNTPALRLSGGQQQRVAVARALIMQPVLLLADEPTGNLDSQSADAVFELFRQVNRDHGTAVLLVTHNPLLASRCDRTIQVIDGMVPG